MPCEPKKNINTYSPSDHLSYSTKTISKINQKINHLLKILSSRTFGAPILLPNSRPNYRYLEKITYFIGNFLPLRQRVFDAGSSGGTRL
jgi:hypothetical protein